MDILDARARERLCSALIERSSEGVYCFELEEPVSTRLSMDDQIEAFYHYGFLSQCNETMAQMYGLSSPREMVGARLGHLLLRSEPRNQEYLRAFVRGGYFITDAESHEVGADDEPRYFLNNLIGIVERGCLVRAWGTQRDITEQRRAEIALQEANDANGRGLAQWRAVIDTMSDGLIVAEASGNVIEWNPAALHLHGYESVEEVRRHIATFTNVFELSTLEGEPVPMEEWPLARALRGETFGNESFRLRRTDTGVVRVLSYSGGQVGQDGGGLAHVTMRDETARIEAEEALRQKEERLREVTSLSSDWAFSFWIRPDGTMVQEWIEGAFEKITGHMRERFQAAPGWLALAHPEDIPRVQEFQVRLQSGAPGASEHRIVTATGETRWVRVNARVVREGRLGRMIGAVQDVTERRQAEDALFRMNEELERRVEERTAELRSAYQEMEALNYSVSHDLRTPLRSVVSTSRILLEDHRDKLAIEARDQLERQARAARKMGELIDGLLTYSRLGREEPKRADVDLVSLAREAYRTLSPDDEPPLRLETPESLPAYGDPRLLRMLLTALLDNSRKFGKPGEEAWAEIGQEGDAYYVRDGGIGLETQYADRIFRVFERLHLDDAFPGVGIGLANGKRIVERHGGRIWADGQPGDGTTIWFTLPRS